jgi:hypothetical protein
LVAVWQVPGQAADVPHTGPFGCSLTLWTEQVAGSHFNSLHFSGSHSAVVLAAHFSASHPAAALAADVEQDAGHGEISASVSAFPVFFAELLAFTNRTTTKVMMSRLPIPIISFFIF